jgi:DNA-binding transcriptional MocR family regulator
VQAVRDHLPQVRLDVVPRGGFVLWLRLPDGVDEVAFARGCAERSVQVNPGRAWFPAEAERGFVRLSYAAASADAIRVGIARMGEVLDAVLRGEGRARSRGSAPAPPRAASARTRARR